MPRYGELPAQDESPVAPAVVPVFVRRILAPQAWLFLAVVAAFVDLWGSRYNLNPDGISYIDLARHALEKGPRELINGLWSPGYPSLLMWPLEVSTAGWGARIPALHFTNLLLYLMSLGLFLQLLRTVASPPHSVVGPSNDRHAVAFGAAAFAAIALTAIGLGLITPDFGVMLAVLATAACCLQFERSRRSWAWAVALGVILALGSWVKGILLPLNGMLLFLLLVMPPRIERARAKVAAAAVVFALVSLPLVALVSAKVGRVTVGEVGRLNYAWEIDGVTPYVGWLGDSTGRFGSPMHPPRVLQRTPLTLEFARPIRATYPLWYDPSYWYAGVKVRIDPGAQWRVLRQGIVDLARLLFGQWALVASLIALGFATRSSPARRLSQRTPSILALWSLGAAIVYALVHVEPRYLAGFIATGVVATWAWLATRAPRRALPWVMLSAVLLLALSLVRNLQQNTGGFDPAYRPDYLLDAVQLRTTGLHPGDQVGAVGDAFEQYAAFVMDTPITAQVVDSAGYWELTPAGRSELQQQLAQSGVKALLANNVQPAMAAEGWQILAHADSTNLGVLLLRAP